MAMAGKGLNKSQVAIQSANITKMEAHLIIITFNHPTNQIVYTVHHLGVAMVIKQLTNQNIKS